MPANACPEARIVSGDENIRAILSDAGAVVQHAFACRLDGFVNDTFTEYANASVYRPASVCRARLRTSIQYTFGQAGSYVLGFTMYAAAGARERIHVHLGAEEVAVAEHPDPDNRVHLFLVPGKRKFIGGEIVRLFTDETDGPCRVENIVLLEKVPPVERPRLRIRDPHVDIIPEGSRCAAAITWTTDRPALGSIEWWPASSRKGKPTRRALSEARANHEHVIHGLPSGERFSYRIALTDRTGKLSVAKKGSFRTSAPRASETPSSGTIPLRLRRAGAGPWPVTVGVPFERGTLGSAAHLALSQNDGTIPLQARALSSWPDGSVKWAQLDFMADGRHDGTVLFGPDVESQAPETPVRVTRSRRELRVDTGAVRVTLSPDRVGLPGRVEVPRAKGKWVDVAGTKGAPAVHLTDASGRAFQGTKTESVDVEESGPNRACIRVVAVHRARGGRSLFRSIFRFHFFAGSAAIRCDHTFENDAVDVPFAEIRSLTLRTSLEVGSGVRADLEGADLELSGKTSARLEQLHDDRWRSAVGKRPLGKGKRASGAARVTGAHGTVAIAFENFWENYPKALSVSRDELAIDICPRLPAGIYPDAGELEDRLFFWHRDGNYRLKRGMARTHTFWIDFDADDTRALPECVASPPLYSVDLETFNASRVLTPLPSRSPSPYPPYERWVEAARTAYAEDRAESRAWGMFNFGDWFGERTYNWGNMEYDTPWCFLQEYLRGGHVDFFVWADQAARHLVDVDTCHHGDGGFLHNHYLHSIGHVGDYYPDGYRPRSICSARTSVSHTWVEGLFLHHALTGDPRSRESAEKVSANLVGGVLNDYDFTNCRNSGWHLIHLSAAYRATGRRVFLNAARIIVDRVLERQRDSGGWDRLMVPGHCYCDPPRHTGNAGFMVGILMVGLKRFHEATGEQRIADAIVRAADYCIDRMWVPEKAAFHYTCCPESSIGGGADMRILKGVAAAHGFTGHERFRRVLEAGVKTAMAGKLPRAHRGIGKGICSPMRGAPQVLASLPD